ncbi:hypothetical protein CI610_01288 [invertebrate metagenome]|uniref:Cupin type-2 domain-containing protein n=1 Tax=invertebrate metagenome TaxID=1711999 RepID=A0A2H9T905_9ZZZZ
MEKNTEGNLWTQIPSQIPKELFETLFHNHSIKIERIVSRGHVAPENEWYDQNKNEWVILLKGRAVLRIEDQRELVNMEAGDYLFIPAHQRHRVEWTEPEADSVWLAVHFI